MMDRYVEESIELLKRMISIPSVSRGESAVADMLQNQMTEWGMAVNRKGNNLWVREQSCSGGKPVILLNSHIDTVKPAAGYTRDPFTPEVEDGKLYGLGSNDAGGPLVSLLAVFRRLTEMEEERGYSLIFAASCEEEVSGRGGLESILAEIGNVDLAIVGEPTGMQPAVAEKGLMVLDCTAIGKSGHAARGEGINAIYQAMPAIEWFQTHQFDRVSQFLGPVKTTVTQIEAGTQHNVVPDTCRFVVDVRINELYTNTELLGMIKRECPTAQMPINIQERSTRLGSSRIAMDHPIVKRAMSLGLKPFGSPTMSDQALMPFTSIKIGPGQSSRSHTANEFIELDEIRQGVETYMSLLKDLRI